MAKKTKVWMFHCEIYNVYLTNINLEKSYGGNLVAIGKARSKKDPVIYTYFVTNKDWIGVEYYALEFVFTSAYGNGVLELHPSKDAPCAILDTVIGKLSYFTSTSHTFKLLSDPIKVEKTPANKNSYGKYLFCVTHAEDFEGCLWDPKDAGNHIVLSKINLYHYKKRVVK